MTKIRRTSTDRSTTDGHSRTAAVAGAILAVAGLALPAAAEETKKQSPAPQREPFTQRRAAPSPPRQPFTARSSEPRSQPQFQARPAAAPRSEPQRAAPAQPAPRPAAQPPREQSPRPAAPARPASRPEQGRPERARPAPARPQQPSRPEQTDRARPGSRPTTAPERRPSPQQSGRPNGQPNGQPVRRPTTRPDSARPSQERSPAVRIERLDDRGNAGQPVRPGPPRPTVRPDDSARAERPARLEPRLIARPVDADPQRRAQLDTRRERLSHSYTAQARPNIERSSGFDRGRPGDRPGSGRPDWHDGDRDRHSGRRDRDIDININFNFYRGSYDRWYDPWPRHHVYAYDGFGVWWYYGPYRYYCPPSRFVFRSVVYTSTVYEHHYYYGLAHYGTRADCSPNDVLALVDDAWRQLECGDARRARHLFAQASELSPDWGLPKIGYALSASASGHEHTADRILRQALGRDPHALLEVPWSEAMESVLRLVEDNALRHTEHDPRDADAWLFVAAVRVALGDPDGAADAAFRAEAAGDTSQAVENLLDLLSGVETD